MFQEENTAFMESENCSPGQGLGLEYARQLVAAGCRCLVLTSRSGTLPLEALQEFASAGVTVFTISADSGDAKESAAALRWAHEHLPPVQHYAHAAGVSGFAMLDSLSETDFWDVAKPKVNPHLCCVNVIR
jgi:NAD(P)-dependent dehydrogenase (short-subunit alcohol dehydrogenase family)